MRAAAAAVLLALFGVFASEYALAGKDGGGKGGGKSGGHSRPQASSHKHGSGHHHHHKSFVGVGAGFGYPWGWWYPPYYYYPYPVAYPLQAVKYIEQGGAPAVEEEAWWYYCGTSTSYYPYVRECPNGWERVPASPPPN